MNLVPDPNGRFLRSRFMGSRWGRPVWWIVGTWSHWNILFTAWRLSRTIRKLSK